MIQETLDDALRTTMRKLQLTLIFLGLGLASVGALSLLITLQPNLWNKLALFAGIGLVLAARFIQITARYVNSIRQPDNHS